MPKLAPNLPADHSAPDQAAADPARTPDFSDPKPFDPARHPGYLDLRTRWLAAYRKLGAMDKASQAVGVHKDWAYYWLDEDPDFWALYRREDRKIAAAQLAELRDEGLRRAKEHKKPREGYRAGSDTLLIWLAKVSARRLGLPEYDESGSTQVNMVTGGPVTVYVAPPDAVSDARPLSIPSETDVSPIERALDAEAVSNAVASDASQAAAEIERAANKAKRAAKAPAKRAAKRPAKGRK